MPNGVARSGQRRQHVRAVHGGHDEDGDEGSELGEEKTTVCGPHQAGEARHVRDRAGHARSHEKEHRDQRDAGEAARRAHGIGAGGRADLTAGHVQQEGERDEGADPEARPQDMHGVHGHRPHRPRGNRGGVAGAAHKDQRQRGQHERFPAGGDPVPPLRDVGADREKGSEHDQETVPPDPDEPRPCVQGGTPHRAGLERGVGTVLEERGAHEQPDDARAQRHEHAEPRGGHDRPVPPACSRGGGRPRQQEHEERPREVHASGEVHPEGGEEERGHSMRNEKRPWVTWASTESTRQITVYAPRGSGGSVARRRAGFERSTRLSRRSTCSPRPFTTRTVLYAASRGSVK